MGIIIKVCLCLISSQNKMFTLSLGQNQIGDAGAASIGGALAYGKSRQRIFFLFDLIYYK